MIEYKYEKMIYKAWEPEYEIGGFSSIEVDAVDLIKYPKIKDVPWSFVTVNAGDCLFLPKSKLLTKLMSARLRFAFFFTRFIYFSESILDKIPGYRLYFRLKNYTY